VIKRFGKTLRDFQVIRLVIKEGLDLLEITMEKLQTVLES